MKATRWASTLVVLGTLLLSPSADATYNIHVLGYRAGGGATTLHFMDVDELGNPDQMVYQTVGHGSFKWELNGVEQDQALFCLDVYHSFTFGQNWDVTAYPIPPGPPNPPPFNTEQAAWIVGHYGYVADADWARATQLAAWEVSHDQHWAQNFAASTWHATGDFRVAAFHSASVQDKATEILAHAHEQWLLDSLSGHGVYFEPDPLTANSVYGQGMVTTPEIPEPGVVTLLGLGIAGVGLTALRRRR